MPSYNFAQYVGYYRIGQPLVLSLDLAWSTAKPRKGSTLFIGTQAGVRRALHQMDTPLKITLQPQDERLADVLALNSATNEVHRAKFDEQARVAKESKVARSFMKSLKAFLAE